MHPLFLHWIHYFFQNEHKIRSTPYTFQPFLELLWFLVVLCLFTESFLLILLLFIVLIYYISVFIEERLNGSSASYHPHITLDSLYSINIQLMSHGWLSEHNLKLFLFNIFMFFLLIYIIQSFFSKTMYNIFWADSQHYTHY